MKSGLFEDDTNILFVGNDMEELLNNANKEKNKLKVWFDGNKLSLNLIKTKMLFGNCKLNSEIKMEINYLVNFFVNIVL